MRTGRALALLLATSMLICMIPFSNAGSAPTNGGIYDVSTDETWNMGSELNAIVTVEAGATLTISADYTVPAGASITVEEGGTLRVEDGSLTGADFAQAVRMTPNVPTSLMAHSSVASGAFSLRIVAPSGNDMSGWSVSWDDIPAQDMAGDEHVINFSTPKADFRLDFTLNPGSFTDLVIDHLEIDEGGSVTSTPAYLAEPFNCRIAAEYGSAFPLNIAGSAHFEDSAITGAHVMITGAVTTTNADFMASGPLYVRGEGSSLMMTGGTVKMSSEDHDVDADGLASLGLGNAFGVEGTGGLIDLWERNIEEQEIHIPIGSTCTGGYCVAYTIHNIGPNEGTIQAFNVDGVALVPARTVEIGTCDGSNCTVWSEGADIEITNFRTAWNLGTGMDSWSEGTLVRLPWDVSTFEILPHLSHPVISVDSVNIPDEMGKIGRSIPVEITVTNSGADAAAVYIRCNIAGTDSYADMTPVYSAMLLDAGETETLNANWSYGSEGDAGLDCYVEIPLQFMDSSPFISKESASSTRDGTNATVSWSTAEEESGSMLIMLAALGLSVIIGLAVAIRFAAVDTGTDDREVHHGDDEEDERVDRFAEMMDEEDED